VRTRAVLTAGPPDSALVTALGRRVISVWHRVKVIVQSRRRRVHSCAPFPLRPRGSHHVQQRGDAGST
jgi:hypothetical protein